MEHALRTVCEIEHKMERRERMCQDGMKLEVLHTAIDTKKVYISRAQRWSI